MTQDRPYLPDTPETLDDFYRQEDPWKTRSLYEKKIRYRFLKRLVPLRLKKTLELACGEGDFTSFLRTRSTQVTAYDLSAVALDRARRKFPGISFETRDARAVGVDDFARHDAVVWLDALNFMPHSESAQTLSRLAQSAESSGKFFLFSTRILPETRTDMSYRPGYDFTTPQSFTRHVAEHFPNARSVPVQLHFDLRPAGDLSLLQKLAKLKMKILTKGGLYPLVLFFVQKTWGLPFYQRLLSPFVIHLAITAESPVYYDKRLSEDVTDRLINRPAAAMLVTRLIPTAITPNQITAVSFLLGIAAALFIATGGGAASAVGALLLELSIVVDCVDGQLARAKGLTSEWGDIFDHTSDDATLLLICAAAGWALRHTVPAAGLVLLCLLAFSAVLHLTIAQYFYSAEYASLVGQGAPEKIRTDRRRVQQMDADRPWSAASLFPKLLLRYYAFRLWVIRAHTLFFNPARKKFTARPAEDRARRIVYHERQRGVLEWWKYGGVSSIALAFVVFCLAHRLLALLLLLISAGHLFFCLLLIRQKKADRRYLEDISKTGDNRP
ncbi:MAG TPA: CDP-alcohol phosphatidyltransferase family protein [Elusimicrobiota bacterium]|nr:CDP-alcohol phosphatidyltransferase family protein [Elusimicrobiota bacterium]